MSVIAPAGYGKTVLLSQWAARETRTVAWLTLDDFDNAPSVLLTYLAAAIDRIEPIEPSVADALSTAGLRVLATAVPRLASALHRIGRPAVLILDDVHQLTDRTCLDALMAFLEHTPPGFQVAIGARVEPDLPLARFRARRQLLEIGQAALAFDEAESAALTAGAGLRLAPAEIHALTERTEGWAVGIYLATLDRDGAERDPAARARTSARDGYIAEFLRFELASTIDADDLTFLTRTSILDVVEARIAETVSERPGAARRLRSLARANRLVDEDAGPPISYRYHRLLRDYLQAELERREPGLMPSRHRLAAQAYAASGHTGRAVEHALRGDDPDLAARLVAAAALSTFYTGHGDTLGRWLRSLDDAELFRHPPLSVIAAWLHLMYGRPVDADRVADIAERSTYVGSPGDGSASFESSRAMLRAMMARHGMEDALANASLAASIEPRASPWRATASWLLGSHLRLSGDASAADALFTDAIESASGTGANPTAAVAAATRAVGAMAAGDWTMGQAWSTQASESLDKGGFGEFLGSLLVYAVAARTALHRGDLAEGRAALVRAQLLRPLASHAAPWFSVQALLELARAYLAISDPAGARIAVSEAEEIIRRRPGLGTLASELVALRGQLGAASRTLIGSSALTAAELRLLPILSTHLTFQEIADRLYVSRNTVKTEAASIYGKLQASTRSEAIERAVELGLLEPFPGLRLARDR